MKQLATFSFAILIFQAAQPLDASHSPSIYGALGAMTCAVAAGLSVWNRYSQGQLDIQSDANLTPKAKTALIAWLEDRKLKNWKPLAVAGVVAGSSLLWALSRLVGTDSVLTGRIGSTALGFCAAIPLQLLFLVEQETAFRSVGWAIISQNLDDFNHDTAS